MKQDIAHMTAPKLEPRSILRGLCLPFLLLCLLSLNGQNTWQSKLLEIDTVTGKLTYYQDEISGIGLADFSHAGYKGGGVTIPDVKSKLEISAIPGDNTQHIQSAIDSVSRLPIDSNGFRGAVVLKSGYYEVFGSLKITTSGVVLRGSGQGLDPSVASIIKARGNQPANRNVVDMGGLQSTRFGGAVPGSKVDIVSDLVQVGAKKFRVEDSNPFEIGDNIIVYHPCTEKWLESVDYGATSTDEPWKVNSQPILYNTRIVNISCDTIFIDSPVHNKLDRSLSQSYIYKYDRKGIVENIGLENLTIDIEHDTLNPDDEDHARSAVKLTQVENAWVRDCTLLHFWFAGVDMTTANYITISDVEALKPVGPTTGGYKYNFCVSTASQNVLFTNCIASEGRHAFVSNGTSFTAGIVFHNCTSIDSYTASEGHRRWSTGLLYDNFKDIGRNRNLVLGLYNRGRYGTGHGWSSANSVAWNCDSRRDGTDALIVVQRPPNAQNFAIGCKGRINQYGPFYHAPGYFEGNNRDEKLVPNSLYEAQLNDRLKNAVSLENSELDFFKALSFDNQNVHLEWQIKCERYTESFTLERSRDEIEWASIETSVSLEKDESTSKYSSIDSNPLEGISYYRLKVTNKSGTEFLSKTFRISINSAEIPLQIFPNPAQNTVSLYGSPAEISTKLLIYNSMGQLERDVKYTKFKNYLSIDISGLERGIYFIQSGNSVSKLIKK